MRHKCAIEKIEITVSGEVLSHTSVYAFHTSAPSVLRNLISRPERDTRQQYPLLRDFNLLTALTSEIRPFVQMSKYNIATENN